MFQIFTSIKTVHFHHSKLYLSKDMHFSAFKMALEKTLEDMKTYANDCNGKL